MKTRAIMAAAIVGIPLFLGGCVWRDDDPDYVPTSPSTTVIERDDPDVHVNPAPNVTIEKESPPPNVDIDVNNPPIEIKTQPPTETTTGF